MPEDLKLCGLQVYLTDREKSAWDNKRRKEGLTSKGALRKAILAYIAEEGKDGRVANA